MQVTKIMPHLFGKSYKEVVAALKIDSDSGDCCGWASHDVVDGVGPINENATLREVLRIDYDDEGRIVVNFVFGLNDADQTGLILGYDLSAGSGSGWAYGAYCTLKYEDEEVASVSW